MKIISSRFNARWGIAFKTLPFLVAIVLLKFLTHYYNIEFLTLSSLFTAIISANIFLIGFLISGVLVDYKESEKIPGDLASALESMADEGIILYQAKNTETAYEYLLKIREFNGLLVDWFYKKIKTNQLMYKLADFNGFFLAFESLTQANFIVRLKQEQNIIRKMINRVHTIRETSFVGTGYAIAELITFILILGLLFIRIDPYYESLFFVSFVSFILIYMIFFIKDLDNPFGYIESDNLVEDVSLKPLLDCGRRLDEYLTEIKK